MFKVMPGVTVEDMGHKMGLNGVDNAKLSFDNVRVPRENLLNRYSDVSPEGKFSSSIGNGRQRFLTVADQVTHIWFTTSMGESRKMFADYINCG